MEKRARSFAQIKGNNLTKNIVQTLLRKGTYPNCTAFYGQSGCGKSTIAELIGIGLNCSDSENIPCLKCENCMDNLSALKNNTENDYIAKVNIAILDKKDLKDKVKNIFRLQPKLGSKCVYILEEFDILTAEEQKIFLEEISNIPEDVYIIICTSRWNKVIVDIRGRCKAFEMSVPNTQECLEIAKEVCATYGKKPLQKEGLLFLIRHLGNVPREIIKVTELLIQSENYDEESMRSYLGYVSNETYVNFFEKCDSSIFDFVEFLENLRSDGISKFYRGLKEFMLNLTIHIYGKDSSPLFSKEEREKIAKVFENIDETRYFGILDYIAQTKAYEETEVNYALLGLRRHFLNKTEKQVIKESSKTAKQEEINSRKLLLDSELTKNDVDTSLTKNKINEILGTMRVFKKE